jgi:hypothetical protein
MFRARISLALAAILVPCFGAATSEAAGWREEQSWQFRSPAETQTRLNSESLRLQLNGVVGAGAQNGNIILPNSAGSGNSSTLGNSTAGTSTYNVTINGSNNEVTVDGYLNLHTDQHTGSQTSNNDTTVGGDQ